MTEVTPITKEDQLYPGDKVACPCGCAHVGVLRRKVMSDDLNHVRGCPCRRCLGSRSRQKGRKGQAVGRKALGIPKPRYASQAGHEENARGTVRWENKTGRMANAVWTQFFACERQSDAAAAIGDPRPFVATFEPDGLGDGLFVGRLSKLREIVYALHDQYEAST